MYKTILLLSGALLLAASVQAQSFDTSGTGSLKGAYLFRYVFFNNDTSGNLTESCTLTGTMTFDGAGKYSLSNTQSTDSLGSSGLCSTVSGGSYGVQSNGIAQLDNPLTPFTLFGTFSQPVLIASTTEDYLFDLFVAVQAPSGSSANGLLSGAFTVGTLDFPNASASLARQGYFTLSADANGNIAAFTLTGSAQNVRAGQTITQDVAASTYSLSGSAGGTMTFPSATGDTEIVSGSKVLYVSADGNWLVGGSATGSDMLFGFRAPSGTSSNSLLNGTYFTAGMEDVLPGVLNFLDAFYGSITANGAGVLISHERYDDPVDNATYDNTLSTSVTIGSDGTYYDGSTYTYLAGANGAALMQIGSNQQYSLIIGIQAPTYKSTSTVWIDPIGITDAANYTPITNSFAPGELVSLFGTFGVSTDVDKTLPIPTTLEGVQVLVNGQPAPVYVVSQGQISAFIPYETEGQSFATFQVVVNNTKSNLVTVYLSKSAPGIYTATQNGIGTGIILHSDYSEVTDNSPAQPGETVLMYVNGLGPVTPEVADGAAAPSSPLSKSVESADIALFLFDGSNFLPADVLFAGLAPGFAGLYQVNFTLPKSGLNNGDVNIYFDTDEAENAMATIALSGFSDSGLTTAKTGKPKLRRSRTGAALAKPATNPRRALPERAPLTQ